MLVGVPLVLLFCINLVLAAASSDHGPYLWQVWVDVTTLAAMYLLWTFSKPSADDDRASWVVMLIAAGLHVCLLAISFAASWRLGEDDNWKAMNAGAKVLVFLYATLMKIVLAKYIHLVLHRVHFASMIVFPTLDKKHVDLTACERWSVFGVWLVVTGGACATAVWVVKDRVYV